MEAASCPASVDIKGGISVSSSPKNVFAVVVGLFLICYGLNLAFEAWHFMNLGTLMPSGKGKGLMSSSDGFIVSGAMTFIGVGWIYLGFKN